MSFSDIARFRERQAQEEASARLGLSGPAAMARHEVITARATRGAAHILCLVEQGRHAEALTVMNQPDWGLAEAAEEEGLVPSSLQERGEEQA